MAAVVFKAVRGRPNRLESFPHKVCGFEPRSIRHAR
jgi:hypothetical protein